MPHLFWPSPPQICPEGQSPQVATPPHRSGALPQAIESCAQVFGEQVVPPAPEEPALAPAPLVPALAPAPPEPGAPPFPVSLLADSSDEPQAANTPAITQGTLHATNRRIMGPRFVVGAATPARATQEEASYHAPPGRSASTLQMVSAGVVALRRALRRVRRGRTVDELRQSSHDAEGPGGAAGVQGLRRPGKGAVVAHPGAALMAGAAEQNPHCTVVAEQPSPQFLPERPGSSLFCVWFGWHDVRNCVLMVVSSPEDAHRFTTPDCGGTRR